MCNVNSARAMLMKKKVKQKKVVVTKMEWIEPLVDRECQQGKDKQVRLMSWNNDSIMTARYYVIVTSWNNDNIITA